MDYERLFVLLIGFFHKVAMPQTVLHTVCFSASRRTERCGKPPVAVVVRSGPIPPRCYSCQEVPCGVAVLRAPPVCSVRTVAVAVVGGYFATWRIALSSPLPCFFLAGSGPILFVQLGKQAWCAF